jgi:hypothetical protein
MWGDHPVLLGLTAAICLWPAIRIGRSLFGSFLDFVHDAGFGTPSESLVSLLWIAVCQYPYDVGFFFRLVGFVVSVATIAGVVYHVLLFFTTGSLS